jgi:large subunit ribosomal protein L7e
VIRIRGINKLNPKVIRILRILRLRQLHNGVFIRINKASSNLLRKVEPYITFGYPSRETIRKLILKRGYGKVNKQRIPLATNAIIDENLAKAGVHTVEDLVNEIHTVGAHFKEANNFLWPFKLRGPRGGFAAKRHPFQRRGDWGNREEYINHLVSKML